MIKAADLEESAMGLSESERAKLAEKLLSSLSPVLSDDDEGISEAMLRDAEMDDDPSQGISLREFRARYET